MTKESATAIRKNESATVKVHQPLRVEPNVTENNKTKLLENQFLFHLCSEEFLNLTCFTVNVSVKKHRIIESNLDGTRHLDFFVTEFFLIDNL